MTELKCKKKLDEEFEKLKIEIYKTIGKTDLLFGFEDNEIDDK